MSMSSESQSKPRRFRRAEVDAALACLKQEDLQLLRWLLRYPFSRAEDLAQARSITPSTVYRHLTVLQNLGVVERLTAATLGARASCWLYHLSNLGLHIVATQMHRSAKALARYCHADEESLLADLPRLPTLITLQNLINGIHALAPQKLGLLGHRAAVWWACVRDYRHAFSSRERTCVVEASGGLVLQVRPMTTDGTAAPDRWYSLFLLLDTGIESRDLITGQLRGLLTYRESPERWRGEHSYYHAFPTVLVVATTAHRKEHWLRKAREVATQMQAAPLEGAITSLEEIEQQENRAQFPWLLPWRSLSSNAICHLQDLLEPMPQEALPPGLLLPHEWHDLDFEDLPTATTPRQQGRPLPTIVVGHFALRAQQIRMAPSAGTSEQITLLSLRLSRRLLDLLTFILDHPMISIEELAALHGMQLASMERSMSELRRLGCLELVDTRRYQQEIRKRAPEGLREKVIAKADIGQRWQLSACGMRVLAAAHHMNLHTIAVEEEVVSPQKRADEAVSMATKENEPLQTELIQRSSAGLFGLRRVEHNAGVYGFFAHLCQAAQREREQGRKHQLLWWEMGTFIGRRYRHQDRMHNVRPDALAAYQVGERTIRFWLEWDRNTMDARDLAEKFESYHYYIRSREWAREHLLLPWLLIVVPDYDQEQRITRILTEHFSTISGLTVRITTANRITERSPLAEIWLPVLPVQERRGQQPALRCRFFEVDPS